MQEGTFFISMTLGLALISRSSLRKPGSHGFYRFFVWEFMLGLYVMNMQYWDVETDAPHQVVATFLFIASLLLVLAGIGQLLVSGQPGTRHGDTPLFAFEKTTTLVTSGIYRLIRHPMYASLLLLGGGFFFKQPSPAGAILLVIAGGFLVATARVEETENIRYFGDSYRHYMKRSKMFIPFIF